MEALECGHTFHTACIDEYVRIKGLTRSKCCPYKYRGPLVVVVDEEFTNREVSTGSDMVPVYS